jgi:hypothetical protein
MTAPPAARCTRSSRARGHTLWRGPTLNPDRRRARCRLTRRDKRRPASGVAAASSASDAERLATAAGGEVGCDDATERYDEAVPPRATRSLSFAIRYKGRMVVNRRP